MADRHLPPPPPGTWRRDDGLSSYAPLPAVTTISAPPPPPVFIPPARPSVKLAELDPRWYSLEEGGPKVGFTFLCPHCRDTRLGVLFHEHGHEAIQDQYIRAHYPNDNASFIWDLSGQEDFATLSLFPSVDASKSGHWHGFITDGNVI